MKKAEILTDADVVQEMQKRRWGKNTIEQRTIEDNNEIICDLYDQYYQQEHEKEIREIFREISKHRDDGAFYPAQSDWDKDATIFKPRGWYTNLKSRYLQEGE